MAEFAASASDASTSDASASGASAAAPRVVGVLPVPGFALMSYAALVEPLRAATRLGAVPPYRIETLCPDNRASVSSGGMSVAPSLPLSAAARLPVLFVVAGGDPAGFADAEVMAALRAATRAGTVLGGVSGGPVILARAGVMAGRRMTVHWEHAEALREAHPGLALERSLFVIDRDRITCAGGTAPLDMMHERIAAEHGRALAQAVNDWFLYTDLRPPTAPQRADLAQRLGQTHPALLNAVAAMEADPAASVDLAGLARRAGVSPRQLSRLFRERLGSAPMAYFRGLRLELARRLIAQSPLPLTEIAFASGFAGPSHLTRAFRAAFGETPGAFRRRQR